MADITNRFVLKFNSNIDRVVRFTVPRACVDKNAAEVQASMQAIIENGAVFIPNRGIPQSVKRAQRVETKREVII